MDPLPVALSKYTREQLDVLLSLERKKSAKLQQTIDELSLKIIDLEKKIHHTPARKPKETLNIRITNKSAPMEF